MWCCVIVLFGFDVWLNCVYDDDCGYDFVCCWCLIWCCVWVGILCFVFVYRCFCLFGCWCWDDWVRLVCRFLDFISSSWIVFGFVCWWVCKVWSKCWNIWCCFFGLMSWKLWMWVVFLVVGGYCGFLNLGWVLLCYCGWWCCRWMGWIFCCFDSVGCCRWLWYCWSCCRLICWWIGCGYLDMWWFLGWLYFVFWCYVCWCKLGIGYCGWCLLVCLDFGLDLDMFFWFILYWLLWWCWCFVCLM